MCIRDRYKPNYLSSLPLSNCSVRPVLPDLWSKCLSHIFLKFLQLNNIGFTAITEILLCVYVSTYMYNIWTQIYSGRSDMLLKISRKLTSVLTMWSTQFFTFPAVRCVRDRRLCSTQWMANRTHPKLRYKQYRPVSNVCHYRSCLLYTSRCV